MIKPDRHTNPDLSVINISALILKHLNPFYEIGYEELRDKVVEAIGANSIENYPYALNFLFLLGKLEYIDQTDSFRYNATK